MNKLSDRLKRHHAMFEHPSPSSPPKKQPAAETERYRFFLPSLLAVILTVLLPMANINAAEQGTGVPSEPVVITAADPLTKEIPITVSKELANSETLNLKMHARIYAETFAGYRRAFKVYWDGVELTKTENLPETFTMRDGRTFQLYFDLDGWGVPFAANFEQAASDIDNPYYPDDERIQPGLFHFNLGNVSAGVHTLTIERTADGESDLVVDDIQVDKKE